MEAVFNTLTFFKKHDACKEQLNENQTNELVNLQDTVINDFGKYYKPSEVVLNYITLLLKYDENNIIRKRCELNSKLRLNVLFLGLWKILTEEEKL